MPARLPIDPETGLTEPQIIAARYLAAGKSCRFAAREAGVSERWLYNWRKRPVMQREINRLQGEMLDDAGGANVSLQQIAISTLSEILVDPEARASDRIQAARTLMSGSDAFAERKLLERKLSDLEHQLTKGIHREKQQPLAPLPEIEEAALVYVGSSDEDE